MQLETRIAWQLKEEKLPSAKLLCVTIGFVYVCSADVIIVVEHTNQLSIKIQSLRKADLIAELTKRGIEATGNVTWPNKLNVENEKLRAEYASHKKRTDIVHLSNNTHTVDCLCSASDEILFAGSNVEQKVYQVLVALVSVSLAVLHLVSLTPHNNIKLISMSISASSLFFVSRATRPRQPMGAFPGEP